MAMTAAPAAPTTPTVDAPTAPRRAPLIHEELVALAQEGQFERAIVGLHDLLRRSDLESAQRCQILSDLAVLKFQLGDHASALDCILEALRVEPAQPDALANLDQLVCDKGFEASVARARHEVAKRCWIDLPRAGERFTVMECGDATARWPAWPALAERVGGFGGELRSFQLGSLDSAFIPGCVDTRVVQKPLLACSLIADAAVILTEDRGLEALARALRTSALMLGERGLSEEGRAIGSAEDEIARVPIENVARALARRVGLPLPEFRADALPEALRSRCEGRGLELGHGGRKCVEDAIGIDALRSDARDLLGDPDERLIVADELYDYVLVREAWEPTPERIAHWMLPLRSGGSLVLLAGDATCEAKRWIEELAEFEAPERIETGVGASALVLRKGESVRIGRTENLELNQREMSDRALELRSTPTYMEISSTIVCNINTPPCVQCWKHADPNLGYLKADQKHLDRRSFDRVAPYMSRADTLSLHGIGEPLANPALFEYIEFVDEDADSFFVTNALLLDASRIDKLLRSKLRAIDVSIDAATPETYRKIRHHDFDQVVANLRAFIAERDRRGCQKPRLLMNMTLMRENVHELPDFVRLAHELGADSTHALHLNKGVSYRVGWFDYESQHCENDPEAHDAAVEEAYRVAEELGIEFALTGKRRLSPETESEGSPASAGRELEPSGSEQTLYQGEAVGEERFFCPKPWSSTLVDNEGNVMNCCWQARPIGNLRQASFEKIWNGETAQEIRRMTAAGEPHPNCKDSGNVCPWLGRV